MLVRTKDPGDIGEASLFSLKQRESPFNNVPRGQCLPPRDPVGLTVWIQSQAGCLCLRVAPRAGEAGKDLRLGKLPALWCSGFLCELLMQTCRRYTCLGFLVEPKFSEHTINLVQVHRPRASCAFTAPHKPPLSVSVETSSSPRRTRVPVALTPSPHQLSVSVHFPFLGVMEYLTFTNGFLYMVGHSGGPSVWWHMAVFIPLSPRTDVRRRVALHGLVGLRVVSTVQLARIAPL